MQYSCDILGSQSGVAEDPSVIGVVTAISKNRSDFSFSVKQSNKSSSENDCI